MTSQNTHATNTQRPAMARGAHGRWYILATVSLAFFLLAVSWWQKPPTSYTARIDVRQTGEHERLSDRDDVIAAIFRIHEDHAHSYHSDHGHNHGHDHNHHAGQVAGAGEEQPHLLVDVVAFPDEKQISIWCACRSPDAALAEAKMLAEAYIARVELPIARPADDGNAAELQAALARAFNELESAQQQLAVFERDHADDLKQAARGPVVPKEPEKPQPPAVVQPNPQWVEANQRLSVLKAAREELLQSKTFEHPQVRDLQWQIESVEAELSTMPRSLVKASPAVHQAPSESVPDAAPADIVQRHVELQRAVATLQQRHRQAELEAQRHVAKSTSSPPTALAVIADPARIVSTHGAGASLAGVLGGAAFAFLLGSLVAARSQIVREPATFNSLQRVATLGVPVAATLATGDGPALAPPEAANPAWVGWLTFLCELLIAGIALLLLLSALADWQFAAHLVRNPLSALTDAVNCLW